MIVKTKESNVTLSLDVLGGATTAGVPLIQRSISGTAFMTVGNAVKVIHKTSLVVSVTAVLQAGGGTATINLQKNGVTVKTAKYTLTSDTQILTQTVSIAHSEEVKTGDVFSLQYVGTSNRCSVKSGTITLNGAN